MESLTQIPGASPEELSAFFAAQSEDFWTAKGEELATHLFQEGRQRVSAYQDFLKKNHIESQKIHSLKEYAALPSTTKENYYDQYPLEELVLDGKLANNYLICTSSGSTGKPHYWPRFKDQDETDPALVELAYSFLGIDGKSTLIISCLAMGTWVAANMMIDNTLEITRKKNRQVTLITPGAFPKHIVDIVEDVGHFYDQVLFIAYPPTARSVIAEGLDRGLDWSKYSPKFVVGGEPVSQNWKNFMLEKVGSTRLMDIMVIFGMAELHLLSFEAPLSAVIRKALSDNPKIAKKLFGTANLAALAQYNPAHRYLEEEDGELLVSALCGIPLMKYKSHDLGGVMPFSTLLSKLKAEGIDALELLEQEGFSRDSVWKWPFYYSYGRGDAVSIMGANIYPSNIEKFFYRHHNINDFKIGVEHDQEERPQLCVYLELRGSKALEEAEKVTFLTDAQHDILNLLLENNEDFADAYTEEPASMTPRVTLYSHGAGPFSKKEMKQRHVA